MSMFSYVKNREPTEVDSRVGRFCDVVLPFSTRTEESCEDCLGFTE